MKAKAEVPICDKFALTIEEAAAYSNVGVNQLRSLLKETDFQPVMLRIGTKVLLKRELFEAYLEKVDRLR